MKLGPDTEFQIILRKCGRPPPPGEKSEEGSDRCLRKLGLHFPGPTFDAESESEVRFLSDMKIQSGGQNGGSQTP